MPVLLPYHTAQTIYLTTSPISLHNLQVEETMQVVLNSHNEWLTYFVYWLESHLCIHLICFGISLIKKTNNKHLIHSMVSS